MSEPSRMPLKGYRIAVTSSGRAEELCVLLRRYGATVCAAGAIVLADLVDDDELYRQTKALITAPPDILVATTAIGFRGWLAAADRWGLATPLLGALSAARVISRGSKTTGALRAVGLPEQWSPESESSREILCHLLESDPKSALAGRRVAVQVHGTVDHRDPMSELFDRLRAAGADVVPIRVYRWRAPQPGGGFDQLVSQIADGQFDAVTFTSAPAVMATLARACDLGIAAELLEALRCDVRAMCVGPVTAEPLTRLSIPASWPERTRLGALTRHIAEQLPTLRISRVYAAGHRIEIQRDRVVVDEVVRPLSATPMATLRALARHPGAVVAREDLLQVLPGKNNSTHAVESAVLRLRAALGDRRIVTTVVKRGYRLAVDNPPAAT